MEEIHCFYSHVQIEILGSSLLIHSLIRVFELLVACLIKFLRYHLPLAHLPGVPFYYRETFHKFLTWEEKFDTLTRIIVSRNVVYDNSLKQSISEIIKWSKGNDLNKFDLISIDRYFFKDNFWYQ